MDVVIVYRFTVRTQARRLFCRHRPSLSFSRACLAGFPRSCGLHDPLPAADIEFDEGSVQAVPANHRNPARLATLQCGQTEYSFGFGNRPKLFAPGSS
ncbi:uncharacterized protein METZ01_LOCUS255594 [marine metagenome]|uniref:Uncharacterized protein n=1 Tax=marine metagenome TaxID=408172 RepID=A0A382ISS9_9ZZZZ